MKNKKNSNSKKFGQKKKSFQQKVARKINLSEISQDHLDESLEITGFVDRVQQTAGPTVFYVSDGTGTLALKAFTNPGERAYPEINEEGAIKAEITLSEFRETLEGEIRKIKALNEEEKEQLHKKISDLERERAKVDFKGFMIKSPILEKLQDRFIKAATEIKLAIIQNRPIIVRHHNDADGYSSGYSLERAIIPLVEKQHGGGKSPWEFYTRAPCGAPFYELDDSIRDTARSLSNEAKFSNKMPLIIIADNGSSPEDLLAIKQGKVHGIDFIVVDHHAFEEDVITDQTLVHINPFLVGESGENFSAGMLCSELAKVINPECNVEPIPAIGGLADRIDNDDAMDQYLKIAKEKDYDKDTLVKISHVLDFISSRLRFMEAREYIEVLFGEPMEKQKALVNLLEPYIESQKKKGLTIAKNAANKEKLKETTLQTIYIEENFRRGFYPRPGLNVGFLHDDLKEQIKNKKLVTAGILQDAITMRATDEANFSVHDLIKHIEKTLPEAFVEGGGHKNAGAISFIPSKRDQVVEQLKEFIKLR